MSFFDNLQTSYSKNKYKKDHKADTRAASFEITLTKLKGPHKESKEPIKAFLRDQTAREWAAKFASQKLH